MLTLVENSIKHNIISKSSPLTIELSSEGDYISVRNNFNPRNDVISSGVGLENLSARCKLICGKEPVVNNKNKFFEVSIPIANI